MSNNRVLIDQSNNTVTTDTNSTQNNVILSPDSPNVVTVIENTSNIITVGVAGSGGSSGPSPLPSLTAGSVIFSNGTTIAQDNANFFWDDTNNRLGIGNNAPSYSLDVSGTIRGTSDAIINGLTVGKGFTNNASATAFGVDANSVNISLYATSVGYQSLKNNTSGNNTSIGYQSLLANTTGTANTAIGLLTLSANISGGYNTAVGAQCMTFATGEQNSGFGYQVLDNVTGRFNVGMGYRSLRYLTSGEFNTAIGGTSSNNIGTGGYNTTIGYGALGFGTQGNANSNNVAIGFTSLWQSLGNNNTALGYYAGRFIANGSTAATAIDNSILIGYNTKVLANSQTNQIVIGYDETGLGSNTTIIGNSSTITTAVRGNLLLGTTTDAGYKLDVNGTARITSQLTGATANFSGNAAFGTTQIALGGSGGFGGGASYWLEAISSNLTLNAPSSIEFIAGISPTLAYTGTANALSQRSATINLTAGLTGYYNQYKSILNATGNAFANTLYVRGFFIDSGTITPNSTTVIPIGFENVSGTNLFNSTSGSTLIGGQYSALSSSAKLQVDSITQGFLPPRMSTSDRNAISAATGLQIYNTDTNANEYWNGTVWISLASNVLTSYTASAGTVISGDTIKEAIQKVDGNATLAITIASSAQIGNNLFNYYNFI